MRRPVRVALPADAPRRAVLGTAYVMSARARCVVGTDDGAPFLELHPRAGQKAAGLAEEALSAFAGQKVRWALAEAGTGVRAELTKRMLALAARAAVQPQAAGSLPPEAEAKVAAILAESGEAERGEAERDPRGIKTPWSALNKGTRYLTKLR